MKTGIWPKTGYHSLAKRYKIHHHRMEAEEPGEGSALDRRRVSSSNVNGKWGCTDVGLGSSHQMAPIWLWSSWDVGLEEGTEGLKVVDQVCKIQWSKRESEFPSEIDRCAELRAGNHNLTCSTVFLINAHGVTISQKMTYLWVFTQYCSFRRQTPLFS